LFLGSIEFNYGASGMKWFNDAILKVTRKNEPTVVAEFLNEAAKRGLRGRWIQVICFI
jgi:hypothetical protein